MTWLTVTEYLCHQWWRICSLCSNQNPVLSSFVTDHRVCNKSNTTSVTCGAGTAYTFGAPEFTPVLIVVRVARSFVFCVLFRIPLCAISSFLLCPLHCLSFFDLRLLITSLVSYIYGVWLPLWCLRFTASNYLFSILDLRLLITSLVS